MMKFEDEFRDDMLQHARDRFPDLDDRDLVLKIRTSFENEPDDDDEEGNR
jgi:hypothetical protein